MCTRPLRAFQNLSGGRPLFGASAETDDQAGSELKLPCGKCPECVKDYYTQWATRGSRELLNWDSSLFVTLTYSEECLPENRSLDKKHMQDFVKRVKKRFNSTKENPIRQIYCGEYGTQTWRPHYHVIFFNLDMPDGQKWRRSDSGHQIYTSKILTDLWGHGNVEYGYAEPSSIAYLFKYVLKKKTRKEKKHPLIIEHDGISYDVEHEFIQASRNPGIGACYRDAHSLQNGFITVNGHKKKIPKYYMENLRKNNPALYDSLMNLKFDFNSQKKPRSEKDLQMNEKCQKKRTDTYRKIK